MGLAKNKILILGSDGMAGHLMEIFFKENGSYDVFTTSRCSRSEDLKHFCLDVFDTVEFEKILKQVMPDVVINCVGMLVKDCENNPDKAVFVNAYFPQVVNKFSRLLNYKFFHISTDCVFSGRKGKYVESDIPDETNVYGRTKVLGEIQGSSSALTIRTSIIGPEIKEQGIGLFHWFCSQTGSISGYSKAIWSGVTTLELAKFIFFLIDNNQPASGLLHLGNNQSIDKKSLLELFKKYFNKNINILTDSSVTVDKSFCSEKLLSSGYQVPSYEVMVAEMAEWIENHKQKYFYR